MHLINLAKEGTYPKIVNIADKREKYFKLNPFTKKKLEIWVNRQKEIFSL